MIEETMQQLRSAKIDVDVMKAMEAGQKVIEDLREKANLENFQDLVDK